MPRLVVVGQDHGGPSVTPEDYVAASEGSGDRGGRPLRSEQLPVEYQVTRLGQLGGLLDLAVEQLADGHVTRLRIDDGPEAADQVLEIRLVAIVAMDLACPGRRPGSAGIRWQPGMLEEGIDHVEPEPIDTSLQPRSDHRELGVLDGRRPPIEFGLLGQEGVEVELLAEGLPLPARASEIRGPVVGRQRFAVRAEARRVAPQVPVGVRPIPARPRRAEPGMLVAGVIQDQVEDDSKAAPMRLRDQPVEVGAGPEEWVDRAVIADVVAEIESRRRVDRRQPDGIDAQASGPQVIEVVDDSRQVADAVAIAVGEAARVDLVDDAALPPIVAEARRVHDGRVAGVKHRISVLRGRRRNDGGSVARWSFFGLDKRRPRLH